MKKWLVLVAVLLVALLALGCSSGQQQGSTAGGSDTTEQAKEPYKIGAVVSFTGPASPLGEPERKTLLLEAEKINEAGGVNGHPIEVIIEDDASDPKNAVVAAQKLIGQEKVVAVIGGTISPSTLAIKPTVAQAKLPHMAMAAGIPITETPNDWIFRTAQSDAVAVQKVIDYLSDSLKIKKFAILHDANAFGQSGAAELKSRAPKAGLEVVAAESYKTEDTNMTSQLTKIKGTGAEVVVVWGTNPGPAVAAKNMKELGMKIPYVGSHGIANKSFIDLAGSASEGVVFPSGKILVPESAAGEQADVIKAFMDGYKAKYNENANSFAGHAYDALHILVGAMKKVGTDPEKLRDEIQKTEGFNGISGIFNYSADDHDGTSTKDMIMVEVKGGKWVEKK